MRKGPRLVTKVGTFVYSLWGVAKPLPIQTVDKGLSLGFKARAFSHASNSSKRSVKFNLRLLKNDKNEEMAPDPSDFLVFFHSILASFFIFMQAKVKPTFMIIFSLPTCWVYRMA